MKTTLTRIVLFALPAAVGFAQETKETKPPADDWKPISYVAPGQ